MQKALRVIGVIAVVLVIAFFSLRSFTKSASPEAVAEINQNGLTVRVDYSQPSKKGRAIFGGLVPYGQVWRTGANEATVINIGQNVTVAGQPLAAGTYSFWTIPSQQGWIAIFNGQTGQWGTQYDPKKDVLRVPVITRSHRPATEQFTISFVPQPAGADMLLTWDQTEAVVPIRKQ